VRGENKIDFQCNAQNLKV